MNSPLMSTIIWIAAGALLVLYLARRRKRRSVR